MTASARGPEGMAGLAKGLAVIEAFTAERPYLTVSEAAQAAGLTPATARRCLLTLSDLGYLHRDGGQFRPTPRMVRLGAAYLGVSSLPALGQTAVSSARDELDEAVSIAVLEGHDSLIIARAEVQRIVNTGVRMGARLPAHASASGRILLSGLDDSDLDRALAACQPTRTTPHTLVTISEIRDRIMVARVEGVTYTNEELELGMRSMAVPVRDSTGRLRAAMTASTFAARASIDEMQREFLPVLQRHAASLGKGI